MTDPAELADLAVVPDHEELDPEVIVAQVQAYATQLRDEAIVERAQADAMEAAAAEGSTPEEKQAAGEDATRRRHHAARLDFTASECDRALQMYRDAQAQLAEHPDADVDLDYQLAVLRGKRGVQAPNLAAEGQS